jgi:hypothetical protein
LLSWAGHPRLHRHRLDARTCLWTQQAGAAFGYIKIQDKSLLVRGLNVLAATISTPLATSGDRCDETHSLHF